ncbi:MAG: Tol-Pal system beta propeller repeat protein TolB [Pseudomonadota bacterium]
MQLIRLLIAVLLLGHSLVAGAVLRIEVTQGVEGALPIAVVPFTWEGGGNPPQDMAQIISSNLARSGKFQPLARDELVAQPRSGAEVRFGNWKVGGVENLVIGKIKSVGSGSYVVQFQLFDVYKEQQLVGYSFPVQTAQLRQIAHEISDIIFEEITGIRGAFNTQVAYVSSIRKADNSLEYVLQIADSDGYDPQTILSSTSPLMSPAWSPDAQQIAYVSFENRRTSAIYVQIVATGERREVSRVQGINGAPVWSPDGSRLALTLSHKGNPDVYILEVATGRLIQLTRNRSIDTEPAWDPSGTSVIFSSDRSGNPQLYEIPASGGRAKRLTFEGRYNGSASVSPDGKLIALVHRDQGRFRIAVMDRDTRELRVLTDGSLDESPSFAPNGSMIIYATTGRGRGVLGAVSTDGRMKQRFTLSEGDVREPAWSPFLK